MSASLSGAGAGISDASSIGSAATTDTAASESPKVIAKVKQCDACKTTDEKLAYKQCSRCKVILYCGVDCQKSAWPTHKKVCIAPKAETPSAGSSQATAGAGAGAGTSPKVTRFTPTSTTENFQPKAGPITLFSIIATSILKWLEHERITEARVQIQYTLKTTNEMQQKPLGDYIPFRLRNDRELMNRIVTEAQALLDNEAISYVAVECLVVILDYDLDDIFHEFKVGVLGQQSAAPCSKPETLTIVLLDE